jgi:hypothetical protein
MKKQTKQFMQAGMAIGMLSGMSGSSDLGENVKGMALGGISGAMMGGALGMALDSMDTLTKSTKGKKKGGFL